MAGILGPTELELLEDMKRRKDAGNFVPTADEIMLLGGVSAGNMPAPPTQAPPQAAPSAQPQASQMPSGLLADSFQPSMPAQDLRALYGIMAAGADDPTQIGMGFAQRMQYNDQLRNSARQTAASSARTGGFNPIPDSQGRVWFPYTDPKTGKTVLTPATDSSGAQIKADPRYTYLDTGGGSHTRAATSGGAADIPLQEVVSPGQSAGNEAEAKRLEKLYAAQRDLPERERVFAKPGGVYDTVLSVINHPGRELGTGASAPFGWMAQYLPGSSMPDFYTQADKLSSQAFLQSITELRAAGGTVGQLTEREGDKLEYAALALNKAAKEGDYLAELNDFRQALEEFMMASRRAAGYDPYRATIEGGINFGGEQGGGATTGSSKADAILNNPEYNKYRTP